MTVASPLRITEKAWTQTVLHIATLCGYELRFHDNATNAHRRCPRCGQIIASPRNAPGFPDLVLLRPATGSRPARLIVAELKVATGAKGKPRPEQQAWLSALQSAGVETYVWYPHMAQLIADILRRDAA